MAQTSLLSAVALWDHAGDVIYVGQTRGTIAVVDATSLRFLDVIKVAPLRPQRFFHGSRSNRPALSDVVKHDCHAQEMLIQIVSQ